MSFVLRSHLEKNSSVPEGQLFFEKEVRPKEVQGAGSTAKEGQSRVKNPLFKFLSLSSSTLEQQHHN